MGEPSSVLTQATAWTELTPPQRRTRWTLLAFPLLGLVVVVVVFQLVVRLGVSEEAKRSEDEAAVVGAEPAPSPDSARPDPTPVEPESKRPVPRARPPVAKPAAPSPDENCIETKRCKARCDGNECDLECRRGTCQIGLVEGSELECKGDGLCEVWCAGECEVKCEESPCRVHCAPGRSCEIDDCRGPKRQCAGNVRTCNASCE